MKRILLFASLLSFYVSRGQSAAASNDPVEWINPLMGTDSKGNLSNGNTYPSIALPWGMNTWTPQTGNMGSGWQYTYSPDPSPREPFSGYKIKGFKQTHQPSPWMGDYGQFSIMPVTHHLKFTQNDRASWFSHKAETAKPYYYSVYLADADVTTEITPTERAAQFRFTFPGSDSSFIVVDAFDRGSWIKIIPGEKKIVGYTTRHSRGELKNFRNYFVIYTDKPFSLSYTWHDSTLVKDSLEMTAGHAGAVIGFSTVKGEKVHLRVASSFISLGQAELNLRREIANDDFDATQQKAKAVWNKTLSHISAEGGSPDQLRTFYSCLYRMLFFPNKLYEPDATGKPVHYSPYTGEILPGYMFGGTGFWDTFRALYPFLNLVYPSINKEMQEGLINDYKEGGWLPEWSSPGYANIMIGNNSASIVAEAWLKGLRGYDINTLYEALLHGANNAGPMQALGRAGVNYYNELGYVPYDVKINENAARTLEYAYDDFTIYRLAKALNRPQQEIDLYARRSQNYRNLFDPETRLMRGKNKDGSFMKPFNPFKWGDAFTEGNSWHYSWSVFHDIRGLQRLMGGKEMFVKMLDSVFSMPPIFDESYYHGVIHEIREMQIAGMGQYAHGNQPIQHMIYLYDYAGEPWKTQYWARETMNRLYKATPDGYCGDEDNGQTSAWYVFSALGFYPVCPVMPQYVLGAPLFPKITLTFENGNKLIINAPGNSDANRYVGSLRFNGKPWDKNFLDHFDLQKGGVLDFTMSPTPNRNRGIKEEDFPYSFSSDTSAPSIPAGATSARARTSAGNDNWNSISTTGFFTKDSVTRSGYTLIFINKDSLFDQGTKNKMTEAFFTVYPQEAKRFNTNTLPKVTFIIDPGYKGVAATGGGISRYNPKWLHDHPEDIDVVTHEVMHIVQAYNHGGGPGWLTEGIADYVRYTYGVNNISGKWTLPDYKEGQSYTNSYRITARFLIWLEKNLRKTIVDELDAAMRSHTYTPDLWKQLTGKTLDECWAAYAKNPALELSYK